MATVEQRYAAATAYVRRAVALVEWRGMFLAPDPITTGIEWYAGRAKTQPARDSLNRIEARWRLTNTDADRAKIALEAELLADRVEESLPGAPQNRARTNLFPGEQPKGTPPTSFYDELAAEAGGAWAWLKDRAHDAAHGADQLGKWLLIGGGVIAGWKLIDLLRAQRRDAGSIERQLNRSLVHAARNARPIALEDTELHTWFERDRARVELREKGSGRTIVEWLDDDVQQAIEDGFLPHFAPDAALHRAAFEYAKYVGLIQEPRNASRAQRYSIRLTRGEIEALKWLQGRYASAKVFVDGLIPLDDSADRGLGGEFDRNDGPYRFQIRAVDVRKTLRATKDDGGNYGAIPNLRSEAVDWVLAQEQGS